MTINSGYISGWDIGGAHLKVARCDLAGNIIHAIQVPCPLWQGIEQLEAAIKSVFKLLNNQHDIAAITMTGELVDIFTDRQQGVGAILNCVSNYIDNDKILVYGAEAGWLAPEQACQQWQQVASRNWQASASLAAQYIDQGLFVDIGSTTCDIIPLLDGQAIPQGFTDFERQKSGELLYTGVIRTPLIALSQTAPFNGNLINIAAEVFATTGDCWCLLDQLDSNSIKDNSADGQPWQVEYCATRIARLLGTDAHQANLEQWQQLARWFAQQQAQQISKAIIRILEHVNVPLKAPIIGAGIGRFVIKSIAQQLDRPYRDLHDIIACRDNEVSDHAPAAAVALLAWQQLP